MSLAFSISGTLPPGLSFNISTGAITGTPTQAGTWDELAITVTDSTDSSNTATLGPFSIEIDDSDTGGGGSGGQLDFSDPQNSGLIA